nr:integrase, catalytic region, zinc finger, CCHC-type, peptidase aspartic, catalytic [Tanacetum cinerariifolium]
IAICMHWCRPIRKEEIASWDGGKSTWGGRAKGFGTVPVCVSVEEMVYGGRSLLAGKYLRATVRKGGLCQLGIEGKRTWGGRGVIWYCSCVLWCTGIAVGKRVFLAGKFVKGGCLEKYAKLKAERYEYMIRYSAYFDNDKQYRKQIADQQVLFDKMSVQLVELDKHVRDLKNTVLEKDFKISELEECVRNKDLEIEKCLERYTPMFLTHSDEALEIEKFKRSRENKIEFAYDYGNLNASYVNEKINFEDDYFQDIINPDFEKIDSAFWQTSSPKPYVPNVILEKIIIDLEDEVVHLLEKEKLNLKTIESLKSKGIESSKTVSSELGNQSKNDCHVVEKQCGNMESSKVIAPGMFKLNVSQCVSLISMSKSSCDSKNVEIKLSRKRRKRKSSKQNVKQVNNDGSRANSDFVHFSDLDTFSSIVQIYLWIINSGCSKHMTGTGALLTNFVEKFLRTVRFGNNDFAIIAGYGDVVIGSMTIKKVYYVEGLGHNLISIGKFCDKGLKVAFRKSTCFVRNEDGVDLLTGDRSSNLYTIALNEVALNSLTCLLVKASSSQFWLWHQRLSHLNLPQSITL